MLKPALRNDLDTIICLPMAWLPNVPVGEVGSSSTFFPVPNISNMLGWSLWKGRMKTMHFMMTLKRDLAKVIIYQDPSILRLTLGRNYVKAKITRIHPSLDRSSQSTTRAQTRAPPDINDALNMNMIAIRIIFYTYGHQKPKR